MDFNTSYEPADLIIHVQDKGIVLREKSLIAYRKQDGKILAYGTEAERMIGIDAKDIVVMSPLRQGFVADASVAQKLFSGLLVKALGKKPFRRPSVAVCVPHGMTEVEKKAIEEVLVWAGAKEAFISNIPVEEFANEFSRKSPDIYQKYKIVVGITKNEPERYVKERLRDLVTYAEQEHITLERISALLQELQSQ